MSLAAVAKVAGCSSATVSRVLNNRPGVSSETVAAVEGALETLNYVPVRRRRRSGGSHGSSGVGVTLGLIIFSDEPTLVSAPIAASVLHEVETAATEAGASVAFGQVRSGGRLPRFVEDETAQGLIVYGSPPPPEMAERLRRAPCMFVMNSRSKPERWANRVLPDNFAIGELAAEYLLGRGHRRLVYVNPQNGHLGFQRRREGFAETAGARDAEVSVLACDTGETTQPPALDDPAVTDLVERLMRHEGRPLALFVPRDRLAIRVHQRLVMAGLREAEIDLISCDNDPILAAAQTRLTTIDLRTDLVAQTAVHWLLDRIAGPQGTGGAPDDVRFECFVKPRLVETGASGSQLDAATALAVIA